MLSKQRTGSLLSRAPQRGFAGEKGAGYTTNAYDRVSNLLAQCPSLPAPVPETGRGERVYVDDNLFRNLCPTERCWNTATFHREGEHQAGKVTYTLPLRCRCRSGGLLDGCEEVVDLGG